MREGGCACGQVRFRVGGEAAGVGICHCRTCARTVGASGVPWATFESAALELTGDVAWWASSPRAERGHCPACGTSLVFRSRSGEGPWVDLTVASFDRTDDLVPTEELWVASRDAWRPPLPGVVQHEDRGDDWSP